MLRHAPYESHISPYLNRNDGNYTEEDAKHFIEGIRAAGWATAQAYVEHCFRVMEQYHLYQFDNMTWEQYQEGMEGAGRYDGMVTEQMQAIVCGSGSGYMGSLYGHVGIYLGNGMVANNVGHFSIESLSNWISWQTATCQGYTGWIGWVYPGGVPN